MAFCCIGSCKRADSSARQIGSIFQHFGHTEQFKLYDVENGQIVKTQVVDINGQGHGALAGVGIKLFGGVSSHADETVKAYAEGKLDYNPDVHCTHHEHGEGYSCGEHHCGEHQCQNK